MKEPSPRVSGWLWLLSGLLLVVGLVLFPRLMPFELKSDAQVQLVVVEAGRAAGSVKRSVTSSQAVAISYASTGYPYVWIVHQAPGLAPSPISGTDFEFGWPTHPTGALIPVPKPLKAGQHQIWVWFSGVPRPWEEARREMLEPTSGPPSPGPRYQFRWQVN